MLATYAQVADPPTFRVQATGREFTLPEIRQDGQLISPTFVGGDSFQLKGVLYTVIRPFYDYDALDSHYGDERDEWGDKIHNLVYATPPLVVLVKVSTPRIGREQ